MEQYGGQRAARREDAHEGDGNVLFCAPSIGGPGVGACLDACHARDGGPLDVLAVSYTRSGEEWLADWRAATGALPERTVVVGVDETVRGAEASEAAGRVTGEDHVRRTAESPDDLTGIGITLSQHLASWGGDDTDTVVCFDSLTALLQYVPLERAYRFLHVLTGRTAAVDARADFHVDPTAHDERTIATLTSLFDAVVEPADGEDGWRTRTR